MQQVAFVMTINGYRRASVRSVGSTNGNNSISEVIIRRARAMISSMWRPNHPSLKQIAVSMSDSTKLETPYP